MFDFVFLYVRVVDAHEDGVGSVNRDEDNDDIYIMMQCLSLCNKK